MMHLLLAALLSVIPVHGTYLTPLHDGTAIVRLDAVPQMQPTTTRRVSVEGRAHLGYGVGFDALLDRSTQPWTLRDARPAGPFAPGVPDPGRVIPLDLNRQIPSEQLIDQDGHVVDLARAFAGKTTLISFIFTRCPDRSLCPAISGKYAYLQSHLDPKRFALVEITLDPPYDSPAVLRSYGKQYGADPAIWTMLTGNGSTISHVLNTFEISSLRVSSANFIHNDKLYIVTPSGRVAYIVETGGWDPDGVIAQARSVDGLSSNGFERFKLSLVASVVALCGGSQFAGAVLLEIALFFAITAIVVAGLWYVARVIWARPPV